MLDPKLKEEWLQKVSIKNNHARFNNGRFSANTNYLDAPEEVQLDKDIVMQACLVGKEFVWCLHESYKGNKEFILELIDKGYTQDTYRGISYELRKDSDLFLIAAKRKEDLGYFIPNSIEDDKALMIQAAQYVNIFTQSHIAEKYKYDRDVLDVLLPAFPDNFFRLPKRSYNHYAKNKALMINIAKNTSSFSKLPEKWFSDIDVARASLHYGSYNIQYINEKLFTNEFLLEAVEKYNSKLNYIPQQYHNEELVYTAVAKDGSNLSYAKQWDTDKKLARLALKTCNCITILSDHLKKDKEMVMQFISVNINNYMYEKHFKEDKDVATLILSMNPALYASRPESIKNDETIARMVFDADMTQFKHLPLKLISDKKLVVRAVQANVEHYQCLKVKGQYLDIAYDPEIIKICIDKKSDNFWYLPPDYLEKVRNSGMNVQEYTNKLAQVYQLKAELEDTLPVQTSVKRQVKI